MIAGGEKTAQIAVFYQIIDFLTGCSINYSLLVDPDLIGPWLQQFWATATLKVINDVPHIRAKTAESTDDDFWKDQEEWEIIRWRFHESSGVHTLEIEDGTMIHMLAERRYPLSRELMLRMLEHGMEVEDESETAITVLHL
ncbi:hypothetical protein Tco_0080905 [Tanacetum coccineum]